MGEHIYPFLLEPAYQHYLWGGRRIMTHFDRSFQKEPLAESWELSDRKEGEVRIENGEHRGATLRELHQVFGTDLVGQRSDRFPLLIKLIDAKLDLSIQVHPNEEVAKELKGAPKTEAWVILAAQKGAHVYVGFNRMLEKGEFARAIEKETLPDLLHRIDVEVGDLIFVPSGTIHAIGAGCLILEVQQNSNTTYRAFDYGRIDTTGKKRELHIKEALASTHLTPSLNSLQRGLLSKKLFPCPYFCIDQFKVEDRRACAQKVESFTYYFVLEGRGSLSYDGGYCDLAFGRSYLLPYTLKEWEIVSDTPITLLAISLPQEEG